MYGICNMRVNRLIRNCDMALLGKDNWRAGASQHDDAMGTIFLYVCIYIYFAAMPYRKSSTCFQINVTHDGEFTPGCEWMEQPAQQRSPVYFYT